MLLKNKTLIIVGFDSGMGCSSAAERSTAPLDPGSIPETGTWVVEGLEDGGAMKLRLPSGCAVLSVFLPSARFTDGYCYHFWKLVRPVGSLPSLVVRP